MIQHQERMQFNIRNPKSAVLFIGALLGITLLFCPIASADYPKPSIYPISWELNFNYGIPKRIVVEVPGKSVASAYWYLTYTVTNNTDREQMFLPVFEMLTKDGTVIRSDVNIPAKVFDSINAREKKKFLEPYPKVTGTLRVGEDQAKDGVAIWPEPIGRLGDFSIFVGGLSGEITPATDSKGEPMKSADGKPIVLRKTLQLNYSVNGDEFYPGEDKVIENPKAWVMR